MMCEELTVDFDVIKLETTFDNIVIPTHEYERIMKEALITETGVTLGTVKIVTCDVMPDDCIALRSGDKIVAIVNLAKDTTHVG